VLNNTEVKERIDILKNFVVNQKTEKNNIRKNHDPCQLLPKKHARASPLPHHTSISAFHRALYKRPDSQLVVPPYYFT
jgi:hypothetical protein